MSEDRWDSGRRGGDPIEAYVDELTDRLHGSPAQVRRVVSESAEHLRDAAEAHEATGLSADESALAAVRDFGSAADLARAINRTAWTGARMTVVRDMGETLLLLAAVGMVVVGLAGVAARLVAAVTSAQSVFGLPGNATVSATSCAHWLAVQPNATGCRQAGAFEAAGDLTRGMVVVGLVGLLLLGVLAVIRRVAPHPATLPPILGPAVATTAFGAAAAGLTCLAAGNAVVLATWGQGLWWVSAACSFAAALISFVLAVRRLPRSSGSAVQV